MIVTEIMPIPIAVISNVSRDSFCVCYDANVDAVVPAEEFKLIETKSVK
jgi:hypothetical protein